MVHTSLNKELYKKADDCINIASAFETFVSPRAVSSEVV